VSQSIDNHHFNRLVDCERRGLWAYYFVLPEALAELSAWLT
jgi:ArsR family transcriptional regulator